jgi:hypothetical protein
MKSYVIAAAVGVLGAASAEAGPKTFEFKGLVIGSKTSPAQVRKATGLKCEDRANGLQMCNGALSIGLAHATANIVISRAGILQRIHMTLPSYEFEDVITAFVEKYGDPDKAEHPMLQNGVGQQFQQTLLIWMNDNNSSLIAKRFTGSITDSFFAFSTAEDRKALTNTGKVSASDL